MTYAASVFARAASPPADLRLPRPCWQFYHALDGTSSVQSLADTLGLSHEETTAAIRTLQNHGLIAPVTETYDAFCDDASAPPSERASAVDLEQETMSDDAASRGDGAPTQPALHGPRLWDWLRDRTDNVKDYRNVKAFIMMEAGEALADIGIATQSEIDEQQRFSDEDVVRAFEKAVEENLDTSIPDHCYC